MQHEELRRRSRWAIRAMSWDDPKARYPNVWHDGMPVRLMVFDRVAGRLRLGDLVAVYYPATQKHTGWSERWLGLSRIVGLQQAAQSGYAWVDVETAHRFQPPLKPEDAPRRVFLCCDPGWPEPEVRMFQAVFDAAVAAGFQPREDEITETTAESPTPTPVPEPPPAQDPKPHVSTRAPEPEPEPEPVENRRTFAGVSYGGDMRDPRSGTWLGVAELNGERLAVTRLAPVGRHGVQVSLRDPDAAMMNVEAIGLNFPFALPTAFSEMLLGSGFPDEGWWALVKHLEQVSRPDFLVAADEFRRASGEVRRRTDEMADALSPLNRAQRDLCAMSYHGIRMIGEDRSRFAIRPFESAKGRLLLEVHPDQWVRLLSSQSRDDRSRRRAVVSRLAKLDLLALEFDAAAEKSCIEEQGALDAVLAARSAALAVISGEADKSPEELSPEHADVIRREGWIYGAPVAASGSE